LDTPRSPPKKAGKKLKTNTKKGVGRKPGRIGTRKKVEKTLLTGQKKMGQKGWGGKDKRPDEPQEFPAVTGLENHTRKTQKRKGKKVG